MTDLTRDSNGQFPAFAWPGGYPIIYVCEDSGVLCAACANRANGSRASADSDTPADWRLVASDIHWEGPPIPCDHCGAVVESAYGEED